MYAGCCVAADPFFSLDADDSVGARAAGGDGGGGGGGNFGVVRVPQLRTVKINPST